jgi:hypothetical protein
MKNEANSSSRYWNHNHPRAFEGMKMRAPERNLTLPCPICKGHGAFHLSHNDTNNGCYPYFDASCAQCNGWGYVNPNSIDATCIHEWKGLTYEESKARNLYTARSFSNCVCIHCNTVMGVDSSD